jgi:phosphoribosylformylglycinamidine (FGAM) synthase-like enzyme
VQSAHDCAEGGLAVSLAESCLSAEPLLGADIDFGTTGLRPEVLLFNESQSRVVISVKPENAAAAQALLSSRGVPVRVLGTVTAGPKLGLKADGAAFDWDVPTLHTSWADTIGNLMA